MPERTSIILEDGCGGELSRRLTRSVFLPAFPHRQLAELADAAALDFGKEKLAFSIDSFVVSPLVFPGGDAGKLAVCGTVNDLAMRGARPLWLACAFIVEEGFEISLLRRLVRSLGSWAARCGVEVVTGDTKVVPRGAADGLFITTCGLGTIDPRLNLGLDRIAPGDLVLVSGPIGDHGLAILAAREKLDLRPLPRSDCAPLHRLVEGMAESGADIKFLRDPTRGGLAAVLNEMVEGKGWGVEVGESALPVKPSTRAAVDLLGLDLLSLANEGKLVAVVSSPGAKKLLKAMKVHPPARQAAVVGEVVAYPAGLALLRTSSGGKRVIDWPRGEPIPRIC
jgi:hydrogenase expression/formation protein HypE